MKIKRITKDQQQQKKNASPNSNLDLLELPFEGNTRMYVLYH